MKEKINIFCKITFGLGSILIGIAGVTYCLNNPEKIKSVLAGITTIGSVACSGGAAGLKEMNDYEDIFGVVKDKNQNPNPVFGQNDNDKSIFGQNNNSKNKQKNKAC